MAPASATDGVSDPVVRKLRQSNSNGRACGNCGNDDPIQLVTSATDERGFTSHVRCSTCGHIALAIVVDPAVLTLLRRHSTEGTLCDNVECAMDDPIMLDAVGDPDEFGFIAYVRCTECGQLMSTTCYDDTNRKKVRILSASELRSGDHVAWHTAVGHWHNVIFIESLGVESDGVTSRISVIEYRYRSCCNNKVIESVRRLNFLTSDVYRIVYVDAYTDVYSVRRARQLTRPETNIHPLTGGCENVTRWCKTGHRSSKLSLVVQKLSGEKHEMNVVHKVSTFVSLALAGGIIPDASSGVKVAEAVIFTIIPTVVLFFSVVVAQVKREYDTIEPRRENVIVRGRSAGGETGTPSKKSGRGARCCGCSCCDSDKCHSRCVTYFGALTRVFVRELTAISGPVTAFVGIGYAVSGVLADETWAIAVVELVSAVLVSPPSYGLGVLLGTLVERYLCRCGCVTSTQKPQQQKQKQTTAATVTLNAAVPHDSDDDSQQSPSSRLHFAGPSSIDGQLTEPCSSTTNESPQRETSAVSMRRFQDLSKVTPV